MEAARPTADAAPWHSRAASQALEQLAVEHDRGLSAAEVGRRQREHGFNELPEPPTKHWLWRLLAQFADPLVAALLVAALVAVAVALSEHSGAGLARFGDAIAIMLIVALNAAIGFVHEQRAEAALSAIRAHSAPQARVLREGGGASIVEARLVVPGDVVLLEPGDAVPADLRLLDATAMQVEEASLTGESVPVSKDPDAELADDAQLGDRETMAYAGTTVVAGRGRGVVVATGSATELGRIGKLLEFADRGETPLEQRLGRFSKVILVVCLVLAALLMFVGLLRAQSSWPQLLLLAVSLAVAAIPEGLPAITSIALALGVRRMARRGAIVRRLRAVETLGAATLICSDKTGTLTLNSMTVCALHAAGATVSVSGVGLAPEGSLQWDASEPAVDDEAVRRLLRAAVICNNARVERDGSGQWQAMGTPTEAALVVAARKAGIERDDALGQRVELRELPFDSARKRMSVVIGGAAGADSDDGVRPERPRVLYAKGAPEAVLARCQTSWAVGAAAPLDAKRRQSLQRFAEHHASEGRRVLAVAERALPDGIDIDDDEAIEREMMLLGFVAIVDPLRPEAKQAVAECHRAGIRVAMVTGDHVLTAEAIGRELGLASEQAEHDTWEGGEALDRALASNAAALADATIFARVTPEQKLHIVRAYKRRGDVVAMTGDGVNDAPALKEAQIGVAMGERGTDVARAAAELVLSDDNFATIVAAVREGRTIYRNIQAFVYFLLSANAGLVVAVIGAALSGWMPPPTPLQLLWVNLVTNGLPALALGVDPPSDDAMHVRPRPPREPLLLARHYMSISVVGLVVGLAALALYPLADLAPQLFEASDRAGRLLEARGLVFLLLSFAALVHAFNCRSITRSLFARGVPRNRPLWLALTASALLQLIVVAVPALRPVFKVHWPNAAQWALLAGLSLLVLPAAELLKLVLRRADRR